MLKVKTGIVIVLEKIEFKVKSIRERYFLLFFKRIYLE